ncbi:unnamed protein product [Mytilus edulis]|uniref:Uncharacterized protein n=1 Tax=Mytilus edulis TaxID=6550 RepID=A0A8S3S4B3_MYTED|nr:unnamed protein product [Mytilus edulis]
MDEEIKKGTRVRLCNGAKGIITGTTSNFNFPLYDIQLQSGKTVTEARYRFDIIESQSQTPFTNFYSQQTTVNSLLNSPVLQQPRNSQLESDFLLAQILQNEIENEEPEIENVEPEIENVEPEIENEAPEIETVQTTNISKQNEKSKNSTRFANAKVDDDDIEIFCQEQTNQNTNRKTVSDMKILNEFMNSALDDTRDICVIQPRELNSIICKFLINVRTKSGTEYEPTSVKGMISSFDRYLRANNYGTSIKKGDIFDQARRVLTAKTMDLKKWEKATNLTRPNQLQMRKWTDCSILGRICLVCRIATGSLRDSSFGNSWSTGELPLLHFETQVASGETT